MYSFKGMGFPRRGSWSVSGCLLGEGRDGLWTCKVEEVAEQEKEMLVFKGAFGEMKVAGVPGCKGVFYKGESRGWRRR